MLAADSLVDRIRLGEDSTLKLDLVEVAGGRVISPGPREFADELASIANGPGGTVVLGVDHVSRKVLGIPLEDLGVIKRWFRNICKDSIAPPINAELREISINDSAGRSVPVIRVDLARSLYLHKSPNGYFRRIGRSKREMSPEAVARLIQERSCTGRIRFDESIVHRTKPSDLQFLLARRFTLADPTEDSLRKLRIMANDENECERLTIAGVLLCTEEPQNWLPHSYIQAVSYAGERTDTEYQADSRDIGGPLDEQVVQALHFVQRNMMVRARKSLARSERPQFSARAVFEALVNAVAHRDYSMEGSRIRLHLFKDRLELYVPGSLANTITPDTLHLRQASRNQLIVSLLARCTAPTGLNRSRMMDRRGDGVPIIREECERLSGYLPVYSLLDESELRLVIRAAS